MKIIFSRRKGALKQANASTNILFRFSSHVRRFLHRPVVLLLLVVAWSLLGAQRPSTEEVSTTPTLNASMASQTVPGTRFLHTATTANINSNYTVIDHPLLNNNPDAIFFVTQNWNPGDSSGLYNDHPIGVFYTGTKWAIFNQDLTTMQAGVDFNVFIPDSSAGAFVHTATAGDNIGCVASQCTFIDHPLLNNNPDAVFFITQNWNPGDGTGVYNNHPIGVYYSSVEQKWAIFNQDLAAMPNGADFNIVVAKDATAFHFSSSRRTGTQAMAAVPTIPTLSASGMIGRQRNGPSSIRTWQPCRTALTSTSWLQRTQRPFRLQHTSS